jgi:hypothetical protein
MKAKLTNKRFWKRFLLLLILIPVLLLGSLMIYISANQSNIIQNQISTLNQSYKGQIKVGKSKLSLFGNFPYVSIKVYDVRITETKENNAAELLNVKDIYVGFKLWDIVLGEYDIQSLLIEEGDLNIVFYQNGTNNFENSLGHPSKADSEPDSSTANIHLKKIQFKNIEIHSLDERTAKRIEVFIKTAQGGFKQKDNIIASHIDTEFEMSILNQTDTTFVKRKHVEIHTDINYDERSGILNIDPSGIKLENGDFEFSGSIDFKNDVDLDLFVKGTKPNFDLFIAFAPAELTDVLNNYRNAGEIYFNAQVQGKAGNGHSPHIEADFGAGKAYLENTNRGKKIDDMRFSGHFTNGEQRNLQTSSFSLTDMRATLGKGEFKGSVVVENFESPEIEMQLESNFDLNFIADFFELEQFQNAVGEVSMKMNFHDIIDLDEPEKALQKLNQAYFAELEVKNLSFQTKELPVPLDDLNVHLEMSGKKAKLNKFDVKLGNSDLSITGFISDLPALVHHTNIPVETHLDILSNTIDLTELTIYSVKDSISTGIDEQINNLSLGFTFKSSAKDFTESEYLPKGEFFVDSLYAELKNYPHKLNDFYADILIGDKDLKIVDFKGKIDHSDFHLDGLVHDYSFWMQPELNGDVDLDINLKSSKIRLEDLLTYNGNNYLPEEYRHEEFTNLELHFESSMHYIDSTLHSIDFDLDKLTAKMKVHPQQFHDFRGKVHYEDEHIVIKDFHGEIGQTNFNFDLNYYLGDDQQIKKRDNYFAINADYIDYDALFNFNLNDSVPAEKSVIPTTEDVTAHAEAFNIYELPFTDMQLKANIKHFIYRNLDIKNIIADFSTKTDHFIYIDTLSMDAAGGKVALNGYFNGSNPQKIYFKPDLVLDNVDLDKLLFKFENFGQEHIVSDNLQGRLTTRIKGNIRVYPDLVPDLDQSELEMDVKVLNGRLKNYNPMLALSDYMGDKNLQNVRFDTLKNNLVVKEGRINIPNMTIESTLGHMEFAGTHDNQNNIDYYLRIPWKTVRKAAWQKLVGGKNKGESDASQEDEIIELDPDKNIKYLNLKIKGSIDDYKISLGKKGKK